MTRRPSASDARPLGRKLRVAALSLLASLVGLELIARVARAPFHLESYRLLRIDQNRRGYPAVRDELLGYAPEPGHVEEHSRWGTRVTIDEHGWRTNGDRPRPEGPSVVVVGDSFAFGDEVDDDQTLPAQLELVLGQPVINGGVFGYGFAQSILRGERILEEVPAEWLVVSFIADDLGRSELSRRYTELPWFEVVDGALVLRNVPTVDRPSEEELRERRLKNRLGYTPCSTRSWPTSPSAGGSPTRRRCAPCRPAGATRSPCCWSTASPSCAVPGAVG